MYIKKVKIENIRSISHFEMEFEKPAGWHVLIGDNGSGKSSVLQGMSYAILGYKHIWGLPFQDVVKYHEEKGNVELVIERNSEDDKNSLHSISDDSFSVGIEITNRGLDMNQVEKEQSKLAAWRVWGDTEGWFSLALGPHRRFIGNYENKNRLDKLAPRMPAHSSLHEDNIPLTNGIEWLKKLNYKRLENQEKGKMENGEEKTLKWLKRFVNQGDLLPHKAKIKNISSEGVFLVDGNGEEISLFEMSSGFKSVFSMTFEILYHLNKVCPNNDLFTKTQNNEIIITKTGVVLIDEVDAHLHPSWQTKVGKWFTKYFPKMQFIVTTHSPLVCRACDNGSIWRLAAPGGNEEHREIIGIEKERLIHGNILDAYGTEVFGQEAVHSEKYDEKKEELGRLNMLSALGQISTKEEEKRQHLQKVLSTDDPTGY